MKEPDGNFQTIIEELQQMAEVDQIMRNSHLEKQGEWDASIDRNNTKRMKAIIDEIGWPSISKVGKEASSNAWLLAQHADHDPEFQKKCLILMKAESEGEILKENIAYLEDRVLLNEGKSQLYGTQFRKDTKGELSPRPIKDPENVDERRKEMGLDPLDEMQIYMRKTFGKK